MKIRYPVTTVLSGEVNKLAIGLSNILVEALKETEDAPPSV